MYHFPKKIHQESGFLVVVLVAMGDLNLLEAFSNFEISQAHDVESAQCIQYLCNTAFADVLDSSKNRKFPGSMVVSLSRTDLERLRGQAPIHKPYKSTDLLPWLDPVKRHIPPFPSTSENRKRSARLATMRATGQSLDSTKIEFGTDDGLFRVDGPINLNVLLIDFGGSDGLFQIL